MSNISENIAQEKASCFCGLFRRGSRITTKIYDNFLQPSGLKVTQYSLLSAIKINDNISVSNLATETVLERTTCTRNLKILENKSLVEINYGEDKRVKRVTLTKQGEDVLNLAHPLWEKAQNCIFAKLGRNEVTSLIEELQRTLNILRMI